MKAVLDEILEKIPETFNMAEIMAKAAEKTPYVVVAFQECERMNILTNEMRRSLKELNLGLKVKCGSAGARGWDLGSRLASAGLTTSAHLPQAIGSLGPSAGRLLPPLHSLVWGCGPSAALSTRGGCSPA